MRRSTRCTLAEKARRCCPPLDGLRVMDVDYADVARKLPAMDAAVRKIFGL